MATALDKQFRATWLYVYIARQRRGCLVTLEGDSEAITLLTALGRRSGIRRPYAYKCLRASACECSASNVGMRLDLAIFVRSTHLTRAVVVCNDEPHVDAHRRRGHQSLRAVAYRLMGKR